MDNTTKYITWAVFGLSIFLFVIFLSVPPDNFSIIPLVILLVTLFIAYLYSIRNYEITDEFFIIHRPFISRKIDLNEIDGVRELNLNERGIFLRVFASGGFLGHFGIYYSNQLGYLNVYATKRDNWILITTRSGENLIVSPDDNILFVTQLRNGNK